METVHDIWIVKVLASERYIIFTVYHNDSAIIEAWVVACLLFFVLLLSIGGEHTWPVHVTSPRDRATCTYLVCFLLFCCLVFCMATLLSALYDFLACKKGHSGSLLIVLLCYVLSNSIDIYFNVTNTISLHNQLSLHNSHFNIFTLNPLNQLNKLNKHNKPICTMNIATATCFCFANCHFFSSWSDIVHLYMITSLQHHLVSVSLILYSNLLFCSISNIIIVWVFEMSLMLIYHSKIIQNNFQKFRLHYEPFGFVLKPFE